MSFQPIQNTYTTTDRAVDKVANGILDGARPVTTRTRRYGALIFAVLGVAEMVWPSQSGPIQGVRSILGAIFGGLV